MADELYHSANPFSGLHGKVHYDDAEKKIHVEHLGDVEPTLERNKSVYNGHGGWASDRTGQSQDGMRHVASIPPVMLVKLRDMGIDVFSLDPDMQARLWRLLNSSDYRHLRTTPGVL